MGEEDGVEEFLTVGLVVGPEGGGYLGAEEEVVHRVGRGGVGGAGGGDDFEEVVLELGGQGGEGHGEVREMESRS